MKNTSGFTLLELAVVLAIAAIVVTVAIPSFQNALDTHRVKAAAEELASDLYWAKSEAISSGKKVFYSIEPGPASCYGFKVGAACSCSAKTGAHICDMLRRDVSIKGVSLSANTLQGSDWFFEPVRGASSGSGLISWSSSGGHVIKVGISPVGRVALCSPVGTSNVSGYGTAQCDGSGP